MNQLVTPADAVTTPLTTRITAASTTIIADTTGFDSAGVLQLRATDIVTEVVTYSGVTSNSFTGVTRGAYGTTAKPFAVGANIAQASWMPVIAEADTLATTADIASRNPVIGYFDEGVLVASDIIAINYVGAGITLTEVAPGAVEVAVTSGATAFTDLSDVPPTYLGANGQAVAVNAGGTGLEFIDFPAGGSGLTQPQVMARSLGC